MGIFLLGISLFVFSESESFLIIAFLMPNLFMFKQLGSQSAILGYYFNILSIKFLIKNINKNHTFNWCFLLHALFALITSVFYSDYSIAMSLIRFCFNFSLFSYLAIYFEEKQDIIRIIKMYFVGVIVAVVMGIIYESYFGTLYDGYFSGINSGRNYFGAIITPAITIAILLLLECKNNFFDTILYVITIFLCIVSIILSNSRTSVIGLLIPAALLLSYIFKTLVNMKRIKKILPLLILLLFLLIIAFNTYENSLTSLLLRFEEKDMSTGNNRFPLWQYYFEKTLKTPQSFLFGCSSRYSASHVAHNTILQCFYQLGLCGTVTMIGIFISAFKKILRGRKTQFTTTFPLVAIIFPSLGINLLYADQLSFLIVLCALIMKAFSKPKNLIDKRYIL